MSSSFTPSLNQFTSPPAQKALPAPVTSSARSVARSASQAKATTSSPIISGLIALKASGRLRVRVPISPSVSSFSVLNSGGFTFPAAYPLPDERRRKDLARGAHRAAAPRAAGRARRLSLLRPRRRAALRRQSSLDPQTSGLPLLRHRDAADLQGRANRGAGDGERGRGAARR